MWKSKLSKILFLSSGLLGFFFAQGHGTPLDKCDITIGAGTYTAGTQSDTSNPTMLLICTQNSTIPNEVETVTVVIGQDGNEIPGAISSFTFQTNTITSVYGGASDAFQFTPFLAGSNLQFLAKTASGGILPGTKPTVTISANSAGKLVVLAPGETHAPGRDPNAGHTGKTGTPSTQQAGQAFALTVILTDNWFNKVSSNDVVSFTSGDLTTLPSPGALLSGQGDFNVTIIAAKTTRTFTVTDDSNGAVSLGTVDVLSEGPEPEQVFPFPSPFNPHLGQSMTFRFQVNNTRDATVIIKDRFGQDVWRREVTGVRGPNDILWDGRNDRGQIVAAGVYLIILEVDGKVKSTKRFGVVK